MLMKATIVAYAFLVQCFENATIVAYTGLREGGGMENFIEIIA